MRRGTDIIALLIEFVRYFVAPRTDSRARTPFSRALLARTASGSVRPRARPFMLGYVVISALNERNYLTAFEALKAFGQQVPWENMSAELLRKIFEVAVIHDELAIARRALNQLAASGRVQETELESLRCLVAWRAGLPTRTSCAPTSCAGSRGDV